MNLPALFKERRHRLWTPADGQMRKQILQVSLQFVHIQLAGLIGRR